MRLSASAAAIGLYFGVVHLEAFAVCKLHRKQHGTAVIQCRSPGFLLFSQLTAAYLAADCFGQLG